MALSGKTSYLRLGYQTAVGTKQTTLSNKIYEFTGGGVGADADFTTPSRNNGTFAPGAPIIGQIGTVGNIRVQQDATGLGVWLREMMLNTPTTTEITPSGSLVNIRAAAAYTDGTAITIPAAMQPSTLLGGLSNTVDGINAARLAFTFSGTTAGTDGATITIVGFDQGVVRPLTEVIQVPAGAVNAAAGTQYFSTITSITTDNMTTPGTMAIAGNAGVFSHVLTLGAALRNGLTIEMVKGNIPNTYIDCHVGEATYTVGEAMEFDFSLIGGRAFIGENVAGGSTPTTTTGTTRPPGAVAPDWSTVFKVGDTTHKVGAGSFRLNHGLGTDENPFSRDVFRPAPAITQDGAISMSARVNYDSDTQYLINNAYGVTLAASISAASMDYGAANRFVIVECPNARLSTFPDTRDLSTGQISRQLELQGFAATGAVAARVTVVSTENATAFVS